MCVCVCLFFCIARTYVSISELSVSFETLTSFFFFFTTSLIKVNNTALPSPTTTKKTVFFFLSFPFLFCSYYYSQCWHSVEQL